jgi:soluble cytochrome b562
VDIESTPSRLKDSKTFLSLNHGFDAVIHVLYEVDFRAAKSAQVGNVEDAVVSLSVLSVSSTDLDVVLVSNCLELVFFLG